MNKDDRRNEETKTQATPNNRTAGNNEKLLALINQCEEPQRILNALLALAALEPGMKKLHDGGEEREVIIKKLFARMNETHCDQSGN